MSQKLDTSYGSDEHGMVWGYLFAPDQPARLITSEETLEVLASPDSRNKGEFLWLHFSLSNSSSRAWMQRNLNLPEGYYESLNSNAGSTRVEQDEESLVAVINDVLFDFTLDSSAISSTSLCIDQYCLISARLRPLRSIDHLRAAVRANKIFRSPSELLAQLLQDQAHVLVDILRQSTARVDQIEDQLLANRVSINRSQLGSLRRVLVRLQRLLAPEPAALFRLLNRPPDWFTEDDIQDLRQAAEEFSAAVGDSTALVERVKLLQEELTALVYEQTNRTLFVLTVVTVLALPINLTTGLFGMNVGGIPLAGDKGGFYLILVILVVLTVVLAYVTLIRKRD
ncbi:MAG: transporter [Arenimonas sp.]